MSHDILRISLRKISYSMLMVLSIISSHVLHIATLSCFLCYESHGVTFHEYAYIDLHVTVNIDWRIGYLYVQRRIQLIGRGLNRRYILSKKKKVSTFVITAIS